MQSPTRSDQIASDLLEAANLSLSSCVPLQSLWAGYGQICRIQATPRTATFGEALYADSRPQSLILKYVAPPGNNDTKSTNVDEGFIRKILSYQVEQYFYTHLATQMPKDIAIASCLTSPDSTNTTGISTAMILTDLCEKYPVPGGSGAQLSHTQTLTALQWLANFHGFWWANINSIDRDRCVLPPVTHFARHKSVDIHGKGGVWLNGGYSYLATRQSEYALLKDDFDYEWSVKLRNDVDSSDLDLAEKVAKFLSSGQHGSLQPYQTLLHGDVKSENFFTTADGTSAAFYDFQYVGLGCGASDLAKFFTCSVPLNMLVDESMALHDTTELVMQEMEEDLLRRYLAVLQQRSGKMYEWDVFVRHWETALVDWLRFQASWGTWGNTEWLEARVRSILEDGKWRDWLETAIKGSSN